MAASGGDSTDRFIGYQLTPMGVVSGRSSDRLPVPGWTAYYSD